MSRFTGSVLVVSDPHQGELAYSIVRRHFPQATLVSWKRGTPRTEVREAIRRGPEGGGKWDLVLSFNNDLLFEQADLDAMGDLRLNIHPALIRGLGYGTWPIIHNHDEYGVLLHYITLDVDHGPIISRLARPLPADADFTSLRLRSQVLALAQLHWACQQIAEHESPDAAHKALMALVEERGLSWSEEYVSGADRDAKLEELRASDPGHRVFSGMPLNGEAPPNVTKLPWSLDPDAALSIVLGGGTKFASVS